MERFGPFSGRGGKDASLWRGPGGREAYQRGFDIVKQTAPGTRCRSPPSNQHIVMARPSVKGDQRPGRLAQPALGAVADDCAADLAGGGESDPHQRFAVGPVPGLDDHCAARSRRRLGGGQEVGPLAQAFDGKCGGGFGQAETLQSRATLGGKALAALGAAALDHLLAVLGGHPGAVTVTALAHESRRLKGPLHRVSSGKRRSKEARWIGEETFTVNLCGPLTAIPLRRSAPKAWPWAGGYHGCHVREPQVHETHRCRGPHARR